MTDTSTDPTDDPAAAAVPTTGARPTSPCRSDRGEGVISTAIAVLIIAFLGVAMWVGFKSIFDDATNTTRDQIQNVGR